MNIIKKILQTCKITPGKLEEALIEAEKYKKIEIDKYSSEYCGHRRYLWDFFSERVPIRKKLIIGKIKCDIQKINNVSSSKSELSIFKNLNDVVLKNSKELIYPVTRDKLAQNISHEESKIFHSDEERLEYKLFEGILTWINNGGSHHFMAARYVAKQLGERIEIEGILTIEYLDIKEIAKIFEKYEIFIINYVKNNFNEYSEPLLLEIKEFIREFPFDKRVISTKIRKEGKAREQDFIFLILKKNNRKEKKIINLLKEKEIYNLESYLNKYLKMQERNLEELQKKGLLY